MRPIILRTVRAVPLTFLAALLAGCGSCQGPELAPRAPVEGRLPVPRRPPQRPATPARQACAVLGFPSADDGAAPLEIQLEAQGDCTEGDAVFSWEFGDGTPPVTGGLVVHTFEKPGTYKVKVTATSTVNPKLRDMDEFEIVVRKLAPGSDKDTDS